MRFAFANERVEHVVYGLLYVQISRVFIYWQAQVRQGVCVRILSYRAWCICCRMGWRQVASVQARQWRVEASVVSIKCRVGAGVLFRMWNPHPVPVQQVAQRNSHGTGVHFKPTRPRFDRAKLCQGNSSVDGVVTTEGKLILNAQGLHDNSRC